MIVPIVKCTKIDPLPKYTYSGTAPRFKHDGNGNWEICFTGDCDITFSRILQNIDVFVVAGGRAGGNGDYSESATGTAKGGNGGKGGGTANGTNIQVFPQRKYEVHVGQSDQDSFAFGVTAFSGAGASGGTGGKVVNTTATVAAAGTAGVYAFNIQDPEQETTLFWDGYKYGAGGGGGGCTVGDSTAAAAIGGLGWVVDGSTRPAGGDGKAGVGESGTKYSGGGGGGGGCKVVPGSSISYGGGAGGSGIVIIRNHR
jgi:hypothetical protein